MLRPMPTMYHPSVSVWARDGVETPLRGPGLSSLAQCGGVRNRLCVQVSDWHPDDHASFVMCQLCLPSVPSPAKIGKQHPDRVVETSTLSSVPPPDITYTLALPTSDNGTLSALQLEAITYACQVAGPHPRPF